MLGDHSPWVPHISASIGRVTDSSIQDACIRHICLLPIIEDLSPLNSEFLSLTQPTRCLGVLSALLVGTGSLNWQEVHYYTVLGVIKSFDPEVVCFLSASIKLRWANLLAFTQGKIPDSS